MLGREGPGRNATWCAGVGGGGSQEKGKFPSGKWPLQAVWLRRPGRCRWKGPARLATWLSWVASMETVCAVWVQQKRRQRPCHKGPSSRGRRVRRGSELRPEAQGTNKPVLPLSAPGKCLSGLGRGGEAKGQRQECAASETLSRGPSRVTATQLRGLSDFRLQGSLPPTHSQPQPPLPQTASCPGPTLTSFLP